MHDLRGQRFGRLVVVKDGGERRHKKVAWTCRCDCGTEVSVMAGDLRRSDTRATRSCGCLQRERTSTANGKHHQSATRAYAVWRQMWARCTKPTDPGYAHYGGRGIGVCERWSSLEAFVADMGEPPDGRTLDRIDNDGPYSPENCRWATSAEQARNKRSSRYVMLDGERLVLADAAARLGIHRSTLARRLDRCKAKPEEKAEVAA